MNSKSSTKSTYKERFYYDDPLSKWSACRSTRHRRKKSKISDTLTPAQDTSVGVGNVRYKNFTDKGGSTAKLQDIDIEDSYDISDTEIAVDPSQATVRVILADDELCDERCNTHIIEATEDSLSNTHFLNFIDHPQTLEYSDVIAPLSGIDNEMCIDTDAEEEDGTVADIHEVEIADTSCSHKDKLYESAPITTATSGVLLMKFIMKHRITQEALTDLLKVLQLHCPSPNNSPTTIYYFKKQFKDLYYPINYHYFCSKCLAEVSIESEVCKNSLCESIFKDVHSKSSFIEIPISLQLKCILERDETHKIISESFNLRRNNKHRNYTDIYSGSVYQQLVSSKFFDNCNNISLTLNTDGIPVFRSSNFSFWPLYLTINELPFQMRISKENRILAGLWYGLTKPDMTLFLQPLVDSLKLLYNEGITISCSSNSIVSRAVLLCTTCDLPAKALIMNMVQFNGFYGCSHCLQPGETHHIKERSYSHVYKYMEKDSVGPKRSKQETLKHMKQAFSSNSIVYGIKGLSWLCRIPNFNIIEGMSIDYMHCVLLGVSRLMLRLWFQSQYHQELWYIGNKVTKVDDRLCSIKPPDEIQRTPRSIELTVKFWKAHELRAWLLHYSPVVLYGILPEDYYQHHLLLVESIYLLLQEQILDKEINHAEKLLNHYCFMFAALYGDKHMTINIHNLLHLPEVVRNLGPLWSNSCFPFEAANGELLKLFHGSQSVEKQVVRHISEYHKLPSHAKNTLEPGSKEESVFKKMSYPQRMNGFKRSVSGIPYNGKFSDDEITLLKNNHIINHNSTFYPYLYLSSNTKISALSKSKSTKRYNCCVKYKDGSGNYQKGITSKIFEVKDSLQILHFCIVIKLIPTITQICQDKITNAKLEKHLVACDQPSTLQSEVIPIESIVEKCILMDMTSELGFVFVSQFPNRVEVE